MASGKRSHIVVEDSIPGLRRLNSLPSVKMHGVAIQKHRHTDTHTNTHMCVRAHMQTQELDFGSLFEMCIEVNFKIITTQNQ